MRGTGAPSSFLVAVGGITPARAGNKKSTESLLKAFRGSPPRVRGTVFLYVQSTTNCRITPARAGNSHGGKAPEDFHGDHPRACGEQGLPGPTNCKCGGSPPRVRGTDIQVGNRLLGVWITPARAGNSAFNGNLCCLSQDHPRACGEQPSLACMHHHQAGSPPRVRGTVPLFCYCDLYPGITPARAGNSYEPGTLKFSIKDHPRACGEQSQSCLNPANR